MTTEKFDNMDAVQIRRKRKPTHEQALWFCERYPYSAASKYLRAVLTPGDRVRFRRAEQLQKRQRWEIEQFGRPLTTAWAPVVALDTEYLTT